MPTLGGLPELSGSGAALAAWIAGFLAWTIALWAVGTAMFRSLAGRVLLRWLWTRDKAVVDEVNQVKWEVANGLAFDPVVAELLYKRKTLARAAASRSRKSALPDETRERQALDAQVRAVDAHLAKLERRVLTLEELEIRRARLLEMNRANWWKRSITYLVNDCSFCQQFWVAFAVCLATRIQSVAVGDVLLTAFLYAGSCSLLIWAVTSPDGDRRNGQAAGTCPGGNCGR